MRLGAKRVMFLNMVGTCGAYLALPFVSLLGSTAAAKARLMAACLAFAGFCQSPLVPGQKTLQRNWLPAVGSPARPIHHKLVSLGELFGQGVLASTLTPAIAARWGWRAVNVLMGGGGLACAALWLAFAHEAPTRFRRKDTGAEIVLAGGRGGAEGGNAIELMKVKPKKQRATNWKLFRHPAVLAVLWCKMAEGNFFYTTGQWTPTYFIEVLGCSPMETAGYLAWFLPIQFTGGFMVAALEGMLLRAKVPLLTIRKSAQVLCATWRAAALIAFGMVESPIAAAIAINVENLGQCFHHSGYSANVC